MRPREHLSLIDVFENLNTILEAKSLDDVEVTENFLFLPHLETLEAQGESYWIPAGVNDETFNAIKFTFKSAHNHLQTFYKKIQKQGRDKDTVQNINAIMMMVGEAKKKLEKFHNIFAEKIAELPEYKDIEDFYEKRVIKESKEAGLTDLFPALEASLEKGSWEEEFAKLVSEEEIEKEEGKHILNNLDVVKHDHFYELFYLKDEVGNPFYTKDLARNIKLAVDFGAQAQEHFQEDPLLQIKSLEDYSLHILAKKILLHAKHEVAAFYKNAFNHREFDFVRHLHNATMALMLAANPKNLLRHSSKKGCISYFMDFQVFLREALHDREYQKFVLYASSSLQEMPFFTDLIHLTYAYTFNFFVQSPGQKEIEDEIDHLTAKKKKTTLSDYFESAMTSLVSQLQYHPNGPLLKTVDIIREEGEKFFDPLILGNIPEKEAVMQREGEEILFLRLPSPTKQEYVHVAEITEEFKNFLYCLGEKKEHEKYLMINFQDRTSWREHARSQVLEELSQNALFADIVTVITLNKDSDFYHQRGIYKELSDAKEFMNMFLEQLQDEATGFYFPPHVKKELFPKKIQMLLSQIHETYFGKEKRLDLVARQTFIELAYLYIELAWIDIWKPTMVSHLSKDSLDGTCTVTSSLMALHQSKEWKHMLYLTFGPTLMQRERTVDPTRFERYLHLTKCIQGKGIKGATFRTTLS